VTCRRKPSRHCRASILICLADFVEAAWEPDWDELESAADESGLLVLRVRLGSLDVAFLPAPEIGSRPG
jgi:hypothetical protein